VRVVGLEALLDGRDLSPAVALTFDDGFSNFATEAAPLLLGHGLPVTLFVVSGQVGGDNRWRGRGDAGVPVLPLLDWDELGRLREAGVSLAAHSRTHPRLTRLDASALEAELVLGAEEMHQRLGERPVGLAYPYGDVNNTVAAVAARHYDWACTVEFRHLGSSERPHLLPRIDAWYFRDATRLARWGSADFRAWVWGRKQARRVRAALRGQASQ
jgi:peptidoglycan/xylan/chitin deacetylase (PgdA/CDA1 family)